MKKNDVYILEDRGLLYISGEDAKNFLQNIITKDIEKVSTNISCFGALLTPQGKYLFDFLIIKHKVGYFLDCEKKNIDQLYNQLILERVLAHTTSYLATPGIVTAPVNFLLVPHALPVLTDL